MLRQLITIHQKNTILKRKKRAKKKLEKRLLESSNSLGTTFALSQNSKINRIWGVKNGK